ncbi:Gustatory receptor [Operophtera brumata]|uniref:Gustatory receptor n=1 Tax=Operophtera brumata TaxID=104452 RepID=A0A0L7L2U8_OPEBR|nr:Gustatory receptor [Operophtera brumata]
MSFYTSNSLFPNSSSIPIPNGFLAHMEEKPKQGKVIFLDVTPARTPIMKASSENAVEPLRNNLIDPDIYKDIVYENIKPVFAILRLMGVLPLTRPQPGINQFHIASTSMLYSLAMFVFLVGYVLYLSLHKVQILKTTSEGKFEEAVIEYLFTVYLFPMTVIPIIWYETRKIAGVLNGWVEFEIAYKHLSGRAVPMKLYKKALIIAVIIPVLSTTSVIITHATMVHFKVMQLIPYVFLEILTYLLGGYWYLLCEALSICASILAEDFHNALRHIGPAGKVAEYRALWLRLSKLARNTGIANCYTFTFVSLYLFLIITLSIYGLLSQISEGFGVRTNFQKKLLMVELSWMNTDAQTEVNMFLRATEMNPSQISLGGFFDVNRTLFKSFQISIPDESQGQGHVPEEPLNVTAPTETTTLTTAITTLLTTLAKKKKKN